MLNIGMSWHFEDTKFQISRFNLPFHAIHIENGYLDKDGAIPVEVTKKLAFLSICDQRCLDFVYLSRALITLDNTCLRVAF